MAVTAIAATVECDMKRYNLYLLLAAAVLAGCAEQDPEPPTKTFGGHVGDSYNQMLDQARETVDLSNQQMHDSDQRMQELRQ
jgi:hypothetical protein